MNLVQKIRTAINESKIGKAAFVSLPYVGLAVGAAYGDELAREIVKVSPTFMDDVVQSILSYNVLGAKVSTILGAGLGGFAGSVAQTAACTAKYVAQDMKECFDGAKELGSACYDGAKSVAKLIKKKPAN